MRIFFFRGIIVIVIATLSICLYEMIIMQNTYMHEENVHKQTQAYSPPDEPAGSAGGDQTETETTAVPAWNNTKTSVDNSSAIVNSSIINAQKDMNPDIAAWLRVPNTAIDYPVVWRADNSYYLDHDVTNKKAATGTLFIDNGNNKRFTDFNTVIYGHNMKNGSMFGQLDYFTNSAFFTENTSGRLFLPDCTYALEIYACLSVKQDDAFIYNSTHGVDIDEFNGYVKANALQYRDIHINSGDRIVTLSTCTNVYEDTRIVVLARLNRLD